jgi:integrase
MAERCPQCGSSRIYKAGLRYADQGPIQRWLCRNCGYRFSEPNVKVNVFSKTVKLFKPSANLAEKVTRDREFSPEKSVNSGLLFRGKDVASHVSNPNITILGKSLNALRSYNSDSQICAKEAKNLAEIEKQTLSCSSTQTSKASMDIKGLIVDYCFKMDKQGYSPATQRMNRTALKVLADRGAVLNDAESVKAVIAAQKIWSQARKRNVINAYSLFLKFQGLTWEKPKCVVPQKFPFIPTEQEIDALISGTGPKTATFLQLVKETAMRAGEGKRLMWTNIDFEKHVITLNDPEKGSNPRMWKVSQKVLGMLNSLPRVSLLVFGNSSMDSMKSTFLRARKRLASKLQNPRLLEISFHTLRHWKATMEYHKTRDPYYVKQFLGHKSLRNTEIYINIERTLFESSSDEFTVKATDKPEEVKSLLEVGFEYVCQQQDGLMFLRKRL